MMFKTGKKILLGSIILALGITETKGEKISGIPIGSNELQAIKAFDGDETTDYLGNKSSYSWVGLDFGEPYIISNLKWSLGNKKAETALLGIFQGANKEDFSDAIPIAIIDDFDIDSLTVDCSRGFQYVRYVGPENSYCRISELEFYGVPGKGDDTHLWQLTNLPTVIINTVDGEIPYDKEHEISSTVIIISNNGSEILQQADTGIRERGNFSRVFPKKPWRIKFDKKQRVLGSPAKAKKWTLINNYGDKSLMRNMLAFDIAREMRVKYVPFCKPVDVVLNGEYKGCYQLCDQIEINDGRIEIEEMTSKDISGDEMTGGYLLELDFYAFQEPVWFTSGINRIPVTIKSPDDDKITPEQRRYIEDYFNMVESMIGKSSFNSSYREVFDIDSFIRHMLVNELSGNTDALWSVYMYKERNDPKIYTGPVWDLDLGFNNDNRTYPVFIRTGDSYLWNSHLSSSANGVKELVRKIIIDDPLTSDEILNIWSELRNKNLTPEWVAEKVDEYSEYLDRSQRLNFMRWPILNSYIHQNPIVYGSYKAECEAIINYIYSQFLHLDRIIGYDESDSSVERIESDFNDLNEDPEFYLLTGGKVDKPQQKGVYIIKKGNETKKIMVR